MKSNNFLVLLVIVCLIFCSCSRVTVNYGSPSPNSGNIVIKTTSLVYVNLTVNDSLMVNERFVRSITIKNIPQGLNTIHYSANSKNLKNAMDRELKVNVEKGKTNTQLLTVPPKSTGYWVYSTGAIIALWAFLLIPW